VENVQLTELLRHLGTSLLGSLTAESKQNLKL